jgi:hypothetical protein
MFKNKKPDPVLGILFLAIFMFLTDIGRSSYDFHIRDTYYIIPFWVPSLMMGFHWLIYKATFHWNYSITLVWVHYIMLGIAYLLLFTGKPIIKSAATSSIILLLAAGMIIFLINIAMGGIRKSKAV